MRLRPGLPLLALLLALPAAAQAPYAGTQTRPIKALSAEHIADLRAGRGMGLALAAELNGWPGPMHVLELADRLGLDAPQRTRMETLMASMRTDAIVLGESVIAAEGSLDRLFAERRATPEAVTAATASAGQAQAALRALHLRAHLDAAAVLTPAQLERYAVLRGYREGDAAPQHSPSRHRH